MSSIKSVLKSKLASVGSMTVRRALPFIQQRSIGPWVFFDHFGPEDVPAGGGMDIGPHPHIGLATVTYLFDGEVFHRDSLGNSQAIRPGAINLMMAGKGVVHSERTREEVRAAGQRLHGLQLWLGLPENMETAEPEFTHISAETIPAIAESGAHIRILMGSAYGLESPTKTYLNTLYVEVMMDLATSIDLPLSEERAVYVVSGRIEIDGKAVPEHAMAILLPEAKTITANEPSRLVIIGGAPLGKRHMHWNFVSSHKGQIDQAMKDWDAGLFPTVPGDPG